MTEIHRRPEILPCPFCGKPPEVFPSGDGTGTMIECITPDCVHPHVSYYGEGEAAKRWNCRASDNLRSWKHALIKYRKELQTDLANLEEHHPNNELVAQAMRAKLNAVQECFSRLQCNSRPTAPDDAKQAPGPTESERVRDEIFTLLSHCDIEDEDGNHECRWCHDYVEAGSNEGFRHERDCPYEVLMGAAKLFEIMLPEAPDDGKGQHVCKFEPETTAGYVCHRCGKWSATP